MPACSGEESGMMNVLSSAIAGGGPLGVIASMITPAFLILSAANLISSSMMRLARTVDRARVVIAHLQAARMSGDPATVAAYQAALRRYGTRGSLVQVALSSYYLAIGCFVASSLAIALTEFSRRHGSWFPTWLTIAGAVLLFTGTVLLFSETGVATRMLREEIAGALEGP